MLPDFGIAELVDMSLFTAAAAADCVPKSRLSPNSLAVILVLVFSVLSPYPNAARSIATNKEASERITSFLLVCWLLVLGV